MRITLLSMLCAGVALTSAAAQNAGIASASNPTADKPKPQINALDLTAKADATCVHVVSDRPLVARIYRVEDPPRVVLDFAGATMSTRRRSKPWSVGKVAALRFGNLAGKTARIVVDVASQTRIGPISRSRTDAGAYRLSLDLVEGHGRNRSAICPKDRDVAAKRGQQVAAWQKAKVITNPQPQSPPGSGRKPVIVIDPGHGGVDPGAVVNRRFLEKAIVLAVGKALARRLKATGGFDVIMTRQRDVFISLDDRIEKTRSAKGDLFISLHADSIEESAKAIYARGAAVYILSNRASDAEARRLAEKENAADRLAGILPRPGSGSGGVRNILVDLLKRETERESVRLRTLLVAAMRGKVPVSRQPKRSAAFHVLKQTETPAALIELGYMTHPGDMKLMRQAEWQQKMAAAIAAAVKRFFAER